MSPRTYTGPSIRLSVLCLVSVLSGCSLLGGRRSAEDSAWFRGPEEVLWDATLEVVGSHYPLADVNRASGEFETKAVEFLSPFKGEGRRRQVTGTVKNKKGFRRISLEVWVEQNMELDNPSSSEEAKWRKGAPDPVAARVLLRQIRGLLMASGAFTIHEDLP